MRVLTLASSSRRPRLRPGPLRGRAHRRPGRQGCEVVVACSNWDGGLPDGIYQRDGVEVEANSPIFMPVKGYTWVAEVLQANLLLEARAFEMADRSGGFDLIQIHDWLAASAGWSVHELLGAPLVVAMHDTVRGRNQGQLSAEEQYMAEMEAWICERADLVLTNSEFTRRELIEAYGVDADKLAVVGCGVDPAAFETDTDPRLFRSVLAPPDAPMISFVGRLTPAKGPQVLLEAVPHVPAAAPGCAVHLRRGRGDARGPAAARPQPEDRLERALHRASAGQGPGHPLPRLGAGGGAQPLRAVRHGGAGGHRRPAPSSPPTPAGCGRSWPAWRARCRCRPTTPWRWRGRSCSCWPTPPGAGGWPRAPGPMLWSASAGRMWPGAP